MKFRLLVTQENGMAVLIQREENESNYTITEILKTGTPLAMLMELHSRLNALRGDCFEKKEFTKYMYEIIPQSIIMTSLLQKVDGNV